MNVQGRNTPTTTFSYHCHCIIFYYFSWSYGCQNYGEILGKNLPIKNKNFDHYHHTFEQQCQLILTILIHSSNIIILIMEQKSFLFISLTTKILIDFNQCFRFVENKWILHNTAITWSKYNWFLKQHSIWWFKWPSPFIMFVCLENFFSVRTPKQQNNNLNVWLKKCFGTSLFHMENG